MSWEAIDNVKPTCATAASVPSHGVRVGVRQLRRAKGGDATKWISIQIGADLARKISLVQEQVKCRILLGSGTDSGKVAVSVDASAGNFLAKRNKKGGYLVAINAKSAERLFSLEFEPFTITRVEAIRPTNGQPPFCAFPVNPVMLDVDGKRAA